MKHALLIVVVLFAALLFLTACPPDDDDDNDDATPVDDDSTDDDDDSDDDDTLDDDTLDDDTVDDDTVDDDTTDDDTVDDDTVDDDTTDDDTTEVLPRQLVFGGMKSTSKTTLFVTDDTPNIGLIRGHQLWLYTLSSTTTAAIVDDYVGTPRSVVDRNGVAHLVYFNAQRDCLVHASRSDDGWTLLDLPLPKPYYVDEFSLAVDSAGRLHLTYLNETNDRYLYLYDDGEQWIVEEIDLPTPYLYYLQIALDGDDRPHFAGVCALLAIYYVDHSDGLWNWELVNNECDYQDGFSFFLDVAARAHLGYIGWDGSSYLGYATNQSGAWVTEKTRSIVVDYGFESTMALDASGRPHFLFQQFSDPLTHGYRDAAGDWHFEFVGELQGKGLSLRIYGDTLHAAVTADGSLYYLTADGGDAWPIVEVERIESAKILGGVAVGDDGVVHLAFNTYVDSQYSRQHYATNAAGEWTFTSFGLSYESQYYSRLLLAADHTPYLLYNEKIDSVYNTTLLHPQGGGWSAEVVNTGHVAPTAFAVDDDGYFHYTLLTTQRLYYGHNRAGGWTLTELVNTLGKPADGSVAGECSFLKDNSLLAENDGVVHIAYTCSEPQTDEYYRNYLFYLTNSSGNWRQEKILTVEDTIIRSPRILRSPAGDLEVLFIVGDNLRRWRRLNTGSVVETIYTREGIWSGPLEMPAHYDPNGDLHLLLHSSNGPLYLNNIGHKWHTYEVEPIDQVGLVAEMFVDDDGNAYFAYTAADALWLRQIRY